MIANERQQRILEYLAERKNASVNELMDLLDVSDSTLRRDLLSLEKQGKCERVHGGVSAVAPVQAEDQSMNLRRTEFHLEKKEIGRRAVDQVEEGDLIYIDAGTTTEAMLLQLDVPGTRIVTNSINHAALASNKGYEVTLVGGQFKSITDAIVGEEALDFLDKYSFDAGFFGTNAISLQGDLLTPDLHEAAIKKKAMKQCQRVYVLADSSKLDKTSKIRFGNLQHAVLICNENPDLENALILQDQPEREKR